MNGFIFSHFIQTDLLSAPEFKPRFSLYWYCYYDILYMILCYYCYSHEKLALGE